MQTYPAGLDVYMLSESSSTSILLLCRSFEGPGESVHLRRLIGAFVACADQEKRQGVRTPPPLKNHKNIGFSSNTGPDPLKNRSYQASLQCWTIIGMPAKRHLMAFCWLADDDPLLVVLGSPPSPHQLKKRCPTKLDNVNMGRYNSVI